MKQFILLSTMSVYGLTVGSISKEPKVNPEIIYSHSMLYQPIPATPEKDTTDFVFAGNIGKVQNLDEVFRAVKIIQDEKHS